MMTPARREDVPLVLKLLEQCGLPQEGLHASLATLIVAHSAHRVVGCAALEVYGTVALLRSVAVDPGYRTHGLGQQLIEAQLEAARRRDIQNVYLLTETAQDYFTRFGFHPIDRADVTPTIHASVEWTSACPETAQAMVFSIKEG